jgi:hypothetical protein
MIEVDPVAEIFFERVGGCSLLAQPRNDVGIGDTFIRENGVYTQRHLSHLVQGGSFNVPPRVTQIAAPIKIKAIAQRHISASLTFWQSILSALNLSEDLQAKFGVKRKKVIKVRIELTGVTRETTVKHAFELAVERAKFDFKNRVISALVNDRNQGDKKHRLADSYKPRILVVSGLLRATRIHLSGKETAEREIGGGGNAFPLVKGGANYTNGNHFEKAINFKDNVTPLVVGVYLMEMKLPAEGPNAVLSPTPAPLPPLHEATNVVLSPTSAPLPPLHVLNKGDDARTGVDLKARIIDPTRVVGLAPSVADLLVITEAMGLSSGKGGPKGGGGLGGSM